MDQEEIMQEIQKVPVPVAGANFKIGDIVKWSFEIVGDPYYGTLYIVAGFNSEKPDIVVTRIMDDPCKTREFHASQLKLV
jgi:hypothetical protein